ncbi:MAG: endonuclease/exonuclease/phosphatase family protein [Burkholderiales bacterium]|nr:endonuclease/exonuclease/phosphatase family protein [Burkholderiales bacterium]
MSSWADDDAPVRSEEPLAAVPEPGTEAAAGAAGATVPQRTAAAPSMRVLTVNTHKGFTWFNRRFVLEELRHAIRSVDADLVFLQEVQGIHEGHSVRVAAWPETPHYEFLADRIWPQFAYGRNAVYPAGHHGNAVLSKYPIVGFDNHDVSFGGREGRGLLHCIVRIPGHEIELHAICVHLGLREAHRQRQLALLCGLVGERVPAAVPLLVAGDFNDWRRRADRVLVRDASLREVFACANGRVAPTFPALLPLLPLDRIYVRNARSHRPLALPRHPWARLSDHAPLAAEIGL